MRDSEGKIHRLIQVRKASSSGTTPMLEDSVEYVYDPYGKLLEVKQPYNDSIGLYNPLIYKDYIYDFDTELYYLQSRYYDPEVGRFLNGDGYCSTGQGIIDTNMFAYCGNNPICNVDPGGTMLIEQFGGGGGYLPEMRGGGGSFGSAYAYAYTAAAVTTILLTSEVLRDDPTHILRQEKFETRTYWQTQEKVTTKEKEIVSDGPRNPVHHIVAKADRRAEESRLILRNVGIDPVTDPKNLVALPQSYHASMHTTAYHNYVTERLQLVAGDRVGVEATLASLKTEILERSALGIRWD